MTESQLKAKRRYSKKVKQICIQFYPTETELWDYMQEQTNKQGFIKDLIRKDIENDK